MNVLPFELSFSFAWLAMVIITAFASGLTNKYYEERLMQVLASIIGVSI